jgi:DNA-binding transcriptional LysR family regulator
MRSKVNLSRLDVFVAVAETKGFTRAAERLGATKAMVSQQIRRLEAELATSLFHRTTRHVVLTDAGQRLYARALPLMSELAATLEGVGTEGQRIAGTLRLTTSDDFVKAELGERLARFSDLHPRLTIDLITSDEVLDLVREGIDLAIRTGWLQDSSLRAVRLRTVRQCLVASPALIARCGPCRKPEDVERLPWIAMTRLRSPLTWRFSRRGSRKTIRVAGVLRTNSTAAGLALVRAGAGATILADYMVADALRDGSLVQLLPDWSLPEAGVYAVYPSTRHLPARVRTFLDFLGT